MLNKSLLSAPDAFANKSEKNVRIIPLSKDTYNAWHKKAPAEIKRRADDCGFTARPGQIVPLFDAKGHLTSVLAGVNNPVLIYDFSIVSDYLLRTVAEKQLKSLAFKIDGLKNDDLYKACLGWGLAGYRFEQYKTGKKTTTLPRLLWPEKVDKKSVLAHLSSAGMIRSLVNMPANDLGPDELEKASRILAEAEGLTIRVIKDKELLKNNFPMIYAVGKGSDRRPRLIDMHWGNMSHPKLTLVGKGVCFDTGGLDIKPAAAMLLMKKDMGGAAHALGLALLIIRHKLPVRLRILIPAVENSISGDAFRPMDVLDSRKGITVEVGDTDAEGRLILADALALACEEKPDLLLNFATLTGAARIALGVDVPAIFSNREKMAFEMKDISLKAEDPIWPLPLWQPYRKEMGSDVADMSSTGTGKAGAITAALFLESFVDSEVDWAHFDLYAWEHGGRPGRTRGGAEMTTRTVFAYLQKRYGKK